MSRQVIAELELALDKVLRRYETEYEVTSAEIIGILEILKFQRGFKAVLPHSVDFLKELLEVPVLSQAGPPEGDFIDFDEAEQKD